VTSPQDAQPYGDGTGVRDQSPGSDQQTTVTSPDDQATSRVDPAALSAASAPFVADPFEADPFAAPGSPAPFSGGYRPEPATAPATYMTSPDMPFQGSAGGYATSGFDPAQGGEWANGQWIPQANPGEHPTAPLPGPEAAALPPQTAAPALPAPSYMQSGPPAQTQPPAQSQPPTQIPPPVHSPPPTPVQGQPPASIPPPAQGPPPAQQPAHYAPNGPYQPAPPAQPFPPMPNGPGQQGQSTQYGQPGQQVQPYQQAQPQQQVQPNQQGQPGQYGQPGQQIQPYQQAQPQQQVQPYQQAQPRQPGQELSPYIAHVPAARPPGEVEARPDSSRVFGPNATSMPERWKPVGLVPMPAHADPWLRRLATSVRGGAAKRAAEAGALLSQPLAAPRRIAVVGVRGGSGKSTVAALLASAYATHRGDRVLAIDADPDLGSLGLRLGSSSPNSLVELGRVPRVWRSVDEAERCLGRTQSGSWILSGERDIATPEAVSPNAYLGVLHGISPFFAVTVIDAGAGLVTQLNRAVLSDAHALLLASPASVDGVVSARRALEWINGWSAPLLGRTIAVFTAMSPQAAGLDLAQAATAVAKFGVTAALLPYDRHLAAGSTIEPWRLGEATRSTAVRMAVDALAQAQTA
jgi:MinD-like ATPase involved in chromosome partitioning or flagellar assembly